MPNFAEKSRFGGCKPITRYANQQRNSLLGWALIIRNI